MRWRDGLVVSTSEHDVEDPCEHPKRYWSELTGSESIGIRRYSQQGSDFTDVLCYHWPLYVVDGRLLDVGQANSRLREDRSPVGVYRLLWWLPTVIYTVEDDVGATRRFSF